MIWGKRDLKIVKKLKAKLRSLGVSCSKIATDPLDSFVTGFKGFAQPMSEFFNVGIEGNNCAIRHPVWRSIRRSSKFSKKLENHFRVSDLAFFYINQGYV